MVIGDGIRENMEELASYIHRNAHLNFTLGLIELPIYKNPDDEHELIVTPRILAKTKEIERVVYRITEQTADDLEEKKEEEVSLTISESVFYERLEKIIGLKNFWEKARADIRILLLAAESFLFLSRFTMSRAVTISLATR